MLLRLLLFLGGTLAACAQSETLDLGGRGRLSLFLPGEWKIDTTQFGGQGTLTLTPAKSGVNASGTLTVTFPDVDRFDTKARLKLRVEADGHAVAESSVEGKAYAREFTLSQGYGFYCNFTDRDLRGRPSQAGNYKVMTMGRIRLAADVLVEVQLMADAFNDEAYQQMLGAVEGMEFTPGKGR